MYNCRACGVLMWSGPGFCKDCLSAKEDAKEQPTKFTEEDFDKLMKYLDGRTK